MGHSGSGMKRAGMKTATALILFVALAGCAAKGERTDYQKDAAKGRPLDMPPDLVLPKADGRYVVPDGASETSATYSEYAKGGQNQNQPCVCKEAAAPDAAQTKSAQPAAAVIPPPQLQNRADGSKSILIAEPFDRCWLKVSQALDRAAIVVDDKDRSKGQLYLKGGRVLSVQGKAAEPGKTETCEVSASNGSGAADAEAQRIISVLFKSLGK